MASNQNQTETEEGFTANGEYYKIFKQKQVLEVLNAQGCFCVVETQCQTIEVKDSNGNQKRSTIESRKEKRYLNEVCFFISNVLIEVTEGEDIGFFYRKVFRQETSEEIDLNGNIRKFQNRRQIEERFSNAG